MTDGRRAGVAGPGTIGRSCAWDIRASIAKVEIDTNHFKGNYPDRASLEGCFAPNVIADNLGAVPWTTILPETKMSANKRHFFSSKDLLASGPFSHVRLNMFPDGGISRLRIHGQLARPASAADGGYGEGSL